MGNSTYFISDIHLTLNNGKFENHRRQALYGLFEKIKNTGGKLYILGDFFDFWFEYLHVIPKGYYDVLANLNNLVRAGVEVHFIVGNHDFWTRDFLTEYLNITVHKAEIDIVLDGQTVHLTHGDGLLKDDRGYRLLRKIIRNRLFIWLFRWLHPDIGIGIAQAASGLSRKYHLEDPYKDAKFAELLEYARIKWDDGSNVVIMGHYHLNKVHTEPDGRVFLSMGDWVSHFTYGVLHEGNIELVQWPVNGENQPEYG